MDLKGCFYLYELKFLIYQIIIFKLMKICTEYTDS